MSGVFYTFAKTKNYSCIALSDNLTGEDLFYNICRNDQNGLELTSFNQIVVYRIKMDSLSFGGNRIKEPFDLLKLIIYLQECKIPKKLIKIYMEKILNVRKK